MFEKTGDSLRRIAERLGLERADALDNAQNYLDQRYPGQCRAVSLNAEVLRVVTPNASVASELRLGQLAIIRAVSTPTNPVKRLVITIAQIIP